MKIVSRQGVALVAQRQGRVTPTLTHIRYSRIANCEYTGGMESLKPQDVVVVLKLCVSPKPRPPLTVLALQLGISASEVHGAVRRATLSGLLRNGDGLRSTRKGSSSRSYDERPNVSAIREFLVHGLKYVFPAQRGELTRGLATSYAADPLKRLLTRGRDPIPVWPYAEGKQRGVALDPLYPSAPFAALQDKRLYELLAIADALREGRSRDRKLAEEQLVLRLEGTNAE